MRDPMTWSFPIGRLFGIGVRVHIMLPLVALGLILRATSKDSGVSLGEASLVMLLLFVSILLHELGHCLAARAVDGDASEMLLWPLGGLAYCDLPHTPKAHLVCAIGGPAVNAGLALLAGGALAFAALVPPLNPLGSPYQPRLWHWRDGGYRAAAAPRAAEVEPVASERAGTHAEVAPPRPAANPPLAPWQIIAAQIFWINWLLLLINLLPGFPLDGGRILQAILWWQSGDYRSAMSTASYAGFFVTLAIAVYAIVVNSVLGILLALFIYVSCKQQLVALEAGGDEAPLGYDFSQGYTSLEGAAPQAPPRRKRPNLVQRWLQRRAALRAKREIERREAEDRRMDELLDKVQSAGIASLSDEERRFLARVSARYRGGKA
jgi:Zn-dependent protease